MVQSKILYRGFSCYVRARAALIDSYMEHEVTRKQILKTMVAENKKEEFFQETSMGGNCVTMSTLWTDELKERVFDTVLGRRLYKLKKGDLTPQDELYARPALTMDHKDIQVDSLIFLVYAIVRNERCRKTLEELFQKDKESFYEAYKHSEYAIPIILSCFLLEERQAVKMAIGVIERLRREEESEDSGLYKAFMEVLYSGNRTLKNQIKRLDCLDKETYRILVKDYDDMVMYASMLVVSMVMAEDLDVPIVEGYEFYLALQMFISYKEELLGEQELPEVGEEGKELYKKLQKEHPDMKSFHNCFFMDSNADVEEEMYYQLFQYFGLNLRMLSDMTLEQKDVEFICSLKEKLRWRDYLHMLLTATLCQYIGGISQFFDENQREETEYQQRMEEAGLKEMCVKLEKMAQKAAYLERNKEEQEKLLEKSEAEKRKLQQKIRQMEEEHAGEKEELIGLRNFVFQWGKMENGEKVDREDDGKRLELGQIGRGKMIIIGGHMNWQKKMRQCLPDSQFLTMDNMNFDAAVLQNKKYIVFNTDMLKHGMYYKIMNQKKKGQKILYVHGNNVERVLQEMEGQLSS